MSIKSFYCDTPGPYSALLQKRDRGEDVSGPEMEAARRAVLSNGLTNPFVYRVIRTDDGVLVGYLVGTLHYCNRAMLENPDIQRAVTLCGRLFMEKLPPWYPAASPAALVGKSAGCPFSSHILPRFGMDVLMDSSLCMLAQSRNINCEALETDEEHESRTRESARQGWILINVLDGTESVSDKSDSAPSIVGDRSVAEGTRRSCFDKSNPHLCRRCDKRRGCHISGGDQNSGRRARNSRKAVR